MSGQDVWRVKEVSGRSHAIDPVFTSYMICVGDKNIAEAESRERAEQIISDHNHAAAAVERETRLVELIERTIFALSLGVTGTLEEAQRVQRDHGNPLANLYLDLCAAMGRGHRAEPPAPRPEAEA